jgi:predicted phosphoadenosine phosphosulfate sulfurtransferase
MKIYHQENVFDAALDRIRFLFHEFPEVVVGCSGGKDSTVVFNLALMVARELGRLPLRVMWIDQEVEWQGTVDMVESIMTRPDVLPMWFQMPMVITNNASSFERYNHCWREADRAKWAHPQHPVAIKENRYGTERFHELFGAIFKVQFAHTPACYISGVRTQESPKRFVALTDTVKYQWITWGKKLDTKRGHYTFYPIYDWEISDVWKAIHEHGWPYNRIYDRMYQYGIAPVHMRISNLHHETAIQDLMLVQEIEPETWVRVADRIDGANTIKHLKHNSFACPAELPFMFRSWQEYAEHLIENIVQEPANRAKVRKVMARCLAVYEHEPIRSEMIRVVINTVLCSDWDFTKVANFEISPPVYGYRRWHRGDEPHLAWLDNEYIPEEAKPALRAALRDKPHE